MDTVKLAKTIAALVSDSSKSGLLELFSVLNSIPDGTVPEFNTLLHKINTTEIAPFLLHNLIQEWHQVSDDFSGKHIAAMLGVAMQTGNLYEDIADEIELVWTGPYPPENRSIRSTYSVIYEMINNANKSILVVGYYIAAESTLVDKLIEVISGAVARGCKVTMVLHNDGFNHRILKTIWPDDIKLPQLLCWSDSGNIKHSSLHAKILAVDNHDLLITSANLTQHGLESNIEMGVRIKGARAKVVTAHFKSLQNKGVLLEAQ